MRPLRPEVRLLKPEMRSEVSHQLIMFVMLVVVEAGHVVVVHVVPVGKLYSPIGLWHDLNTFNGENKLLYLPGSPRGHGVMDRASKSASLLVLRVSTRSPRIGEKAAYKTCEALQHDIPALTQSPIFQPNLALLKLSTMVPMDYTSNLRIVCWTSFIDPSPKTSHSSSHILCHFRSGTVVVKTLSYINLIDGDFQVVFSWFLWSWNLEVFWWLRKSKKNLN